MRTLNTITITVAVMMVLLFVIFTVDPLRNRFEDFVNSLTDSNFHHMEKVKAKVDDTEYYVQGNFDDKNDAANMIAELNGIVQHFITHLRKKYPTSAKIKRLALRYNPNTIMEGNPINNKNSTSYSIAKGKKVVFCVRSKHTRKIHKKNLLLFVVIHELSHIMSVSYGHNTEFMNNFKFLLDEAVKAGIYKRDNYFSNPKEYCGMTVSTTPI